MTFQYILSHAFPMAFIHMKKLHWPARLNPMPMLDGLAILLSGLLAWQGGTLLAQWLQPVQTPPVLLPHAAETASAHETTAPPRLSLFGMEKRTSPSHPVSPPPPPVIARPSRLNATLLGTLVSPQGAVALIRYRGQTHILREGEALIPGVTVRTITADSVILDNRGRLEKLSLETSTAGLSAGGTASASGEKGHLTPAQQTRLGRIRQTIRRSPLQLLNYVRVEMVDGGRHLKLHPAREADLFQALGLRAGDVLTHVNGQPVSQWMKRPMEAARLLQQDRITLTIRRQGREETLTLDLKP